MDTANALVGHEKMAFYRKHLLELTEDGFVTKPMYMDTRLSHELQSIIGQMRTSSHQLEIETGLADLGSASRGQNLPAMPHRARDRVTSHMPLSNIL